MADLSEINKYDDFFVLFAKTKDKYYYAFTAEDNNKIMYVCTLPAATLIHYALIITVLRHNMRVNYDNNTYILILIRQH